MACKAFKLVFNLDEQLKTKRALLEGLAQNAEAAEERRRVREEAIRSWRPPVASWVQTYGRTRGVRRDRGSVK